MKRILFVCLGNICRSPAAQGVMEALVNKAGVSDKIFCDSAGTSGWHDGETADERMRSHAKDRGYELTSRSRPLQIHDFLQFDWIITMDDKNRRDLLRMDPEKLFQQKVKGMTDFCKEHFEREVPDPYYLEADGFEHVLDMLEDGCACLLDFVLNEDLG